jgi:hypothetical protein
MKLRSSLFLILLSLVLGACSLAEDITPPPGLSSPTSVSPTITPSSVSPVVPSATSTPQLVATSPSATPESTAATTLVSEASPTAQEAVVDISGTVTNASGVTLPANTSLNLLVYDTTLAQVTQTLTMVIQSDGKYNFTDVPANTNTIYLVTVDYGGVTYDSIPARFDGTKFLIEMPVTVYDTTSAMDELSITQTHLQYDFSTAGQVDVMVLYVLLNAGANSIIISSDGSSLPFIQIPTGATNVQYQLAQSSSPLLSAENGFAFLPGADKQYGIIATFSLPYSKRLEYEQPFSLPVSSATIIVPEGVRVRGEQLTDNGSQTSASSTFHLYQSGSLASGSTLTFTISGMPGDKPFFVLDQRTWLMIGVGAVGLLLIGLGVFLFLRDRRLKKLEEEFAAEEETEGDALGEDRDTLMDAIIALDDQYKAGDISKEAYESRRKELKDRLKNMPLP